MRGVPKLWRWFRTGGQFRGGVSERERERARVNSPRQVLIVLHDGTRLNENSSRASPPLRHLQRCARDRGGQAERDAWSGQGHCGDITAVAITVKTRAARAENPRAAACGALSCRNRLSSGIAALITSDCGSMGCTPALWPESPRECIGSSPPRSSGLICRRRKRSCSNSGL